MRRVHLLRIAPILLGAAFAWLIFNGFNILEELGCFPLRENSTEVSIPAPRDGITRFVALGDTGTGSPEQAAVAQAALRVCRAQGCDFMTLLGDNFYGEGASDAESARFQNLVDRPYRVFGIPIVAILGNHDLRNDPPAQIRSGARHPLWRMPNVRYSFRAGPARFFATNSNCAPLEWAILARDLGADTPEWTFVLAHHALYGTHFHGDSPPEIEWPWRWLIASRADFALAGHNHGLALLERAGDSTAYVVSGSGGGASSERQRMERKALPSRAEARFTSYKPGFVWFAVAPDRVRAVFYDDQAAPLFEFTKLKRP